MLLPTGTITADCVTVTVKPLEETADAIRAVGVGMTGAVTELLPPPPHPTRNGTTSDNALNLLD